MTNTNLSWADAVQDLATDHAVRAELMVVADQLQRHIEPCGPKAVAAVLAPLASLYGVQDKSEAEWRAFWKFYVDALEGLPLEALRAGVDEYVASASSEFFPKPGPLKAICERHAMPLRMAANRAQKALSAR